MDTIRLGPGITSADLQLKRVSNADLSIYITVGTQTGRIIVEDQFNYGSGGGHIERIRFDDGSILRLDNRSFTLHGTFADDRLYGVIRGGKKVDKIFGGGGNDDIYAYGPNSYEFNRNYLHVEAGDDILRGSRGNDELKGGAGDDVLYGDAGNDLLVGGTGDDTIHDRLGDDTYRFSYGHGLDKISDENGIDVLEFGAGITRDDLTFSRYLNDTLQIEIDGGAGGTVHITSQFDYAAGYAGGIESFAFVNGGTLDLTQTQFDTFGSAGDDRIYGIRYGGSQVDRIFGGDGDDELYAQAPNSYEYNANFLSGQRGNDELYGGRGADELLGGHGNDYLSGDSGDDILNGGIGNDSYRGGAGRGGARHLCYYCWPEPDHGFLRRHHSFPGRPLGRGSPDQSPDFRVCQH